MGSEVKGFDRVVDDLIDLGRKLRLPLVPARFAQENGDLPGCLEQLEPSVKGDEMKTQFFRAEVNVLSGTLRVIQQGFDALELACGVLLLLLITSVDIRLRRLRQGLDRTEFVDWRLKQPARLVLTQNHCPEVLRLLLDGVAPPPVEDLRAVIQDNRREQVLAHDMLQIEDCMVISASRSIPIW